MRVINESNKCSVGMFVWITKVYSVKGEAGRSLFRIEFLFHETYLSEVGDTGYESLLRRENENLGRASAGASWPAM